MQIYDAGKRSIHATHTHTHTHTHAVKTLSTDRSLGKMQRAEQQKGNTTTPM